MKAMTIESTLLVSGGEEIYMPTEEANGGGGGGGGGFWSGVSDFASGVGTALNNCATGAKNVSGIAVIAGAVMGPEVIAPIAVGGCFGGMIGGMYNTAMGKK